MPASILRSRPRPRQWVILVDATILAVAFLLSFQLRFEFAVPPEELRRCFVQLPMVLLVQLAALGACHVYGFLWRYIGLAEVRAFVRAAGLSMVPLLALRLALSAPMAALKVPISVTFMTTLLGMGGVLGARVALRARFERRERESHRLPLGNRRRPARTLLVGAGQGGLMAARELARQPHPGIEVVGFIDDDAAKQGAVLHGVRVLGGIAELDRLAREHGVEQLVVTMCRVDRSVLRDLVARGERLGLPVRTMPGLHEILSGSVNVSRLREVSIEDLLGRPPVQLPGDVLAGFLAGRRILVTGAGGSIGAELARQVAASRPERLILVERAEPALFEVHRELLRLRPEQRLEPLVGDVGDELRMTAILRAHRPHLILHAAAHKHVPLMETNPSEAIQNNVLATERLGRLAGEYGVEGFVLVSTDKAVRPTSVMGAAKRLAELVVQDLDTRFPTRYVAVRFGNVLGSTGSVVPIFREQIAAGGPVTVTHPDMVRYFMTIPEAAQLVLQAAALGRGGEIFVLDMGEPVRILDLAREMIRLSGLEPGVDIEIVFTGVRPGEKLYEELQHREEELAKTQHPRIYTGRLQPYPVEVIARALDGLRESVRSGDDQDLRRVLAELLPEARLGRVRPAVPCPVATGETGSGERPAAEGGAVLLPSSPPTYG